jgi:hypothetical protein
LLGLLFDSEYEDMFLRNVRITFNGLHGIISQKTELFVTTAMIISDPRSFRLLSISDKCALVYSTPLSTYSEILANMLVAVNYLVARVVNDEI